MITLERVATISEEGKLEIDVPLTLAPGRHRVVLVIDEAVQEAVELAEEAEPIRVERGPYGLPIFHGLKPLPELGTYRREEIYGDDGR